MQPPCWSAPWEVLCNPQTSPFQRGCMQAPFYRVVCSPCVSLLPQGIVHNSTLFPSAGSFIQLPCKSTSTWFAYKPHASFLLGFAHNPQQALFREICMQPPQPLRGSTQHPHNFLLLQFTIHHLNFLNL